MAYKNFRFLSSFTLAIFLTIQPVWATPTFFGLLSPIEYNHGDPAWTRTGAASGLYYYGARYYDPELGRFIQPDALVPNPSDPRVPTALLALGVSGGAGVAGKVID